MSEHKNLASSRPTPLDFHRCIFSGPVPPIEGVGEVITMPGVDYRQLRASISIAEILQLIRFVPAQASGQQLRGPCPVHGSRSPSSRSFSVNLKTNVYRCFQCGSA